MRSEPSVAPTFGGTYQPLPPLVCGVNVSADRPQPEWAPSTAYPPVPWLVSSVSEPTRAVNGLGLETTSATSAWLPGCSCAVVVPAVTVNGWAVPAAASPAPLPAPLQYAKAAVATPSTITMVAPTAVARRPGRTMRRRSAETDLARARTMFTAAPLRTRTGAT